MLLYCSIHYVLKRNIDNDKLNRERLRLPKRLKYTMISCIGLGVGDLRGSCLLTSKRGPQGPRSTTMYRGNSGPHVNVPCIDVGDLRAPGLLSCIGGSQAPWWVYNVYMWGPQGPWSNAMYRCEGHQGHFNKKLSCIPNINYLNTKCLKALQLLHVVASTD